MGYLHLNLATTDMALRQEEFKEFTKSKGFDGKNFRTEFDRALYVGLTLFEDSGIGGVTYNGIKRPDFSKKDEILRKIEEKSLSKIEEAKEYSREDKAKLRAIFEKIKTDDNLYDAITKQHNEFLEQLSSKNCNDESKGCMR